jgi:hypothetical protein
VLAVSMKDLGRCKTMQFFINLTNETPIYRKKHRLSKHEWELVDEICKKLHDVGLIQSPSFDFTTATVMPTKKDSSGLWTKKKMCGDYRPLNLHLKIGTSCPSLKNCLIALETQTFSQLWICCKASTRLCLL